MAGGQLEVVYSFETFSFDVECRELHRNGACIAVEPQVFDLIHFLIRNRDRVVSKDDLVANVWKGRAVSDSALTSRIAVARQALGDSGEEQRLIRTIARKGVRFIGQVSLGAAIPAKAVIAHDPPDKPSIAVLPLANLSDDPEQNYFVEGMTEEIVAALTRIRALFVISGESSLALQGQNLADPHAAAARLGVRYILQGSVRRCGHRVRIAVNLIDTSKGAQIWAGRFDETLKDIFDVQDQIALRVAGVIEPSVHAAELHRVARQPIENLGCYDLYLRAAWLRATCRKAEVVQALKVLDRALALDPDCAPALAQAAGCHSQMCTNGWGEDREWHKRQGLALAERAIKAGSEDAAVLAQAANAVMDLDQDATRAVALAERATMLNPGCARAWFMSGLLRLIGGDGDRAVEHLRIAARLDPISPLNDIIRVHIGIGHFIQGDLAKALRLIRTTTHRTARIHLVLSALYGALDMPQESRDEVALFHGRSSASVDEMIALMTSQRPEMRNRFYEGLAKGLNGAPA